VALQTPQLSSDSMQRSTLVRLAWIRPREKEKEKITLAVAATISDSTAGISLEEAE